MAKEIKLVRKIKRYDPEIEWVDRDIVHCNMVSDKDLPGKWVKFEDMVTLIEVIRSTVNKFLDVKET